MPRVNDGAPVTLQTMLAGWPMPRKGGSHIAIIFNGSPLSNGDCGSGESEIRRWILENDWLDAIVMLPDQLFYNTERLRPQVLKAPTTAKVLGDIIFDQPVSSRENRRRAVVPVRFTFPARDESEVTARPR